MGTPRAVARGERITFERKARGEYHFYIYDEQGARAAGGIAHVSADAPTQLNVSEYFLAWGREHDQGLGSKALAQLINASRQIGFKKVWLEIVSGSKPKHFWAKNGAVPAKHPLFTKDYVIDL